MHPQGWFTRERTMQGVAGNYCSTVCSDPTSLIRRVHCLLYLKSPNFASRVIHHQHIRVL